MVNRTRARPAHSYLCQFSAALITSAFLVGCVGGSNTPPTTAPLGNAADAFAGMFDAVDGASAATADSGGLTDTTSGASDTTAGASDSAGTGNDAKSGAKDAKSGAKDVVARSDDGSCALAAGRCTDGVRELCGKGGWTATPCDLIAPVCVAGDCLKCEPKKVYCAPPASGESHSQKVLKCDDTGSSAAVEKACPDGPCKDGACLACAAGEHRCNEGKREICAGGGLLWAPDHCPVEKPVCDSGDCYVCKGDESFCTKDGSGTDAVALCDHIGTKGTIVATCQAPQFCADGKCVACTPGETKCTDGQLATCKPNGSGFDATSCPKTQPLCDAGVCKLCKANEPFCRPASFDSPAAVMSCGPKGDSAAPIKACGPGQVCHNNACKNCTPGTASCVGNTPLICAENGTSATLAKSCTDEKLLCGDKGCGCNPGVPFCAAPPVGLASGRSVLVCDGSGAKSKEALACTSEQVCLNAKCAVCTPGALRCNGDKTLFCKANGSGWQQDEDCAAKGAQCVVGKCMDLCAVSSGNPTSRGCRFWAVDLDNANISSGTGGALDAQNAPYGVVVTNAGPKTASVKITFGPGPGVPVAKTTTISVPSGTSKSIVLPPPDWKLPPASQDGTSLQGSAFRIDSTEPVQVTQHNPLQANAFSADASLLVPANGLGLAHRIVGRKQSLTNLRAYIAVVATEPGTTKVTVTSTTATLAGGAIPALKPGVAQQISVQQGQVLNIETDALGSDFTGSLVTADKPIAVFSGAEAAHAPDTDVCTSAAGAGKTCAGTSKVCSIDGDCPQTCCADHVEAQIPPIERLGTTYIGGRLQPRGSEQDTWRVVATENGTRVVVRPSSVGLKTLQAGEWFELSATADVVIESNKPVLVAQFMASSGLTGKSLGDPAMMLLRPVSAMGSRAQFWAPGEYTTNFVTVAAPTGSQIKLDTKVQAAGVAIPQTGWSVWRLGLSAGHHLIESSDRLGGILHGWTKDGSYGHNVGFMGQ